MSKLAKRDLKYVISEIQMLKTLKHPSLIKFYTCVHTPPFCLLQCSLDLRRFPTQRLCSRRRKPPCVHHGAHDVWDAG